MTTIFKTNFLHNHTEQFILLKGMFFLKLCTNDYTRTMHAARGYVSPSYQEHVPLANLVVLRCMLCEWAWQYLYNLEIFF